MPPTVLPNTPPRLTPQQQALLQSVFASTTVELEDGVCVAARQNQADGLQELPLVCLHGIGSGAASWGAMAQEVAGRARIIAWDAPGYGKSTPLAALRPQPADYATRLVLLLDALKVDRCVLVGHSLGALTAAALLAVAPERVAACALISPAIGYGAPGREAERARVHEQRLTLLRELGIAGMADQRYTRLLTPDASPEAAAWVHWNMAQLNEKGYLQAVEMLCGSDLFGVLPAHAACGVHVACGEHDHITPPEQCARVALRCATDLVLLPAAGHACYVERPREVADFLLQIQRTAYAGGAHASPESAGRS